MITIDELRDLDSATDSVSAVQSGTWNIGTVASITADVNVTATDLDIRALTNADVVTVENAHLTALGGAISGTELQVDIVGSLPAGANLIGNVGITGSVATTPAAYDSFKTTAQSITTTESQLAATPLGSRLSMLIQNLGTNDIYVGLTGLSAATGIKIPKKSSMKENFGASAAIYALTSSGTADVRILELAD